MNAPLSDTATKTDLNSELEAWFADLRIKTLRCILGIYIVQTFVIVALLRLIPSH